MGLLAGAAIAADGPEEVEGLFDEGLALGDDSLAPQAMSSKIDNSTGIRLWKRVAMVMRLAI